MEIFHNSPDRKTNTIKVEPLYDECGVARWIEHPAHGARCDVVLLPLTDTQNALLCPYGRANTYVDMALSAGDRITVVGFLMGQSAGSMLAIWCTGYVASEPALDYAGAPKFLIDCRTRQGQSGSPVIAHRDGSMVRMANGDFAMMGGAVFRPFGVYTGRIHPDADVGFVWKWSIVEDLMATFEIYISRKVQDTIIKFGRDSGETTALLERFGLQWTPNAADPRTL